ncbi:MAG: GIY-YIG nuclease family protein [Oligoflexia bacterium]|nr:GIY-YIG nuclease family protein [Oligoflexia bacterium]
MVESDSNSNSSSKIIKLLSKAKSLPTTSGCYLFKDQKENVLYVGKAKNLRNRCSSYFQDAQIKNHNIKTLKLLSVVDDFDFIITDSDSSALILENDLIKKYTPKYNIKLRDDKSYPFVVSDLRDNFPRILYMRKKELIELKKDEHVLIFGPFVESRLLKEVIKILVKHFKIRICGKSEFKMSAKTNTPCILYQIEYCSAPCVGKIGKYQYKNNFSKVIQFFSGEEREERAVLRILKRKMYDYSKEEEYEKAAEIRDDILKVEQFINAKTTSDEGGVEKGEGKDALKRLQEILSLKKIPRVIECYDVAIWQGDSPCGAKVVMRDGKLDKSSYRYYNLTKREEENNDYEMLKELISRRFSSESFDYLDLIMVDGGKGQLNAIVSVLKNLNISIAVVGIAKKNKRCLSDRLFFQNQSSAQSRGYSLEKEGLLWTMLAKLRDEAHRFSRKLHHKKEQKRLLKGITKKN